MSALVALARSANDGLIVSVAAAATLNGDLIITLAAGTNANSVLRTPLRRAQWPNFLQG
jgi:hypothetical protein